MYDTSRKAKNGWNTNRLIMKIEDIVNLTEGTLTNTPKVQAIEAADKNMYVDKENIKKRVTGIEV